LLRQWRLHRRLSQLALATNAEISTRHLSFLETGRANPSREMLTRIAEELQIPLRARNALLTAGGYAEMYPKRDLSDPSLQVVDSIVKTVLAAHEPNPALAIDRRWNILAANRAAGIFFHGVDSALLAPPQNAFRIGLHPAGLASRIRNFAEWRTNALARLKRRIDLTADRELEQLFADVSSYRYPGINLNAAPRPRYDLAIPLELITDRGDVNLITTTMVFGMPQDVTVSELSIECFFPQDQRSASLLAGHRPPET
jgi:transcriptional regulator with XRE-family HTH domain